MPDTCIKCSYRACCIAEFMLTTDHVDVDAGISAVKITRHGPWDWYAFRNYAHDLLIKVENYLSSLDAETERKKNRKYSCGKLGSAQFIEDCSKAWPKSEREWIVNFYKGKHRDAKSKKARSAK